MLEDGVASVLSNCEYLCDLARYNAIELGDDCLAGHDYLVVPRHFLEDSQVHTLCPVHA